MGLQKKLTGLYKKIDRLENRIISIESDNENTIKLLEIFKMSNESLKSENVALKLNLDQLNQAEQKHKHKKNSDNSSIP